VGGRWLQARRFGPSPYGIRELAIERLIAERDSCPDRPAVVAALLDRLDQFPAPVVLTPDRPGGEADGQERDGREEDQDWGW
jgi:hypothetical protein